MMEESKWNHGLFHSVWAPTEAGQQKNMPASPQTILLLCGDMEMVRIIQQEVAVKWPAGSRAAAAIPGVGFTEMEENCFTINPAEEADYGRLAEALRSRGLSPSYILHCWSDNWRTSTPHLPESAGVAVYSLVYLARFFMNADMASEGQLLYAYTVCGEMPAPHFAAAAAFLKSLSRERRGWNTKLVEWVSPESFSADIDVERLRMFMAELQWGGEGEIRMGSGLLRAERHWEPLPSGEGSGKNSSMRIRENGIYIITGGLGAIGLAFARYLAQRARVKLFLLGRSPLGAEGANELKMLEALGSKAYYERVDVSQASELAYAIATIRKQWGPITGLIHCAGLIRDSLLHRKPVIDFKAVLAAKVQGTVNLDEATRDDPLDFFVMASSMIAVLGNIGQTDYAYANRFMDHYSALREHYRKRGERSGVTVSIGWPLWQNGAMRVDAAEASVLHQSGLAEMPTEVGLEAFEQAMGLQIPHVVIAYGNIQKAAASLNRKVHSAAPLSAVPGGKLPAGVAEQTGGYFRRLLGTLLKAPESAFEGKNGFHHLGIDSITVNAFNAAVEQKIGPMPKTLLYECSSIQELVDYSLLHHPDRLIRLFAGSPGALPWQPLVSRKPKVQRPNWRSGQADKQTAGPDKDEAIAIIGLSGRYPGASDLYAFWELLKNGVNAIREVPADRWSISDYYDPDPYSWKKGKMNCKWGGFLDGVEFFDPLLFRISPKEAETMDPQERVFLETAWEALEDAGQLHEGDSRRTGVFVGATSNTNMLRGTEGLYPSGLPTSLPWSIANRVSYYFNLQGPSMPVDTACSSSLTAIHLACDSLRKGECDTALAGGVNLYLHPLKYTYLCQMGMLSPTGACSSFGAGADGFVPGEGAGAVVLKPLQAALHDGDSIYAVIRGTAINHGGLTTGYTVPNPAAQAEVIGSALRTAGVDPRSISYIEAHGTGTALGDPIEISGLTRAFREHTEASGYCAVGSVKTNIGHLESAAGIAGLTKVLLQMKHKQLVPSLHSEQRNPNIQFDGTPFYVQQRAMPWHSTQGVTGNAEEPLRRAGISSFGAGGANAHIIVEEYRSEPQPQVEAGSPELIIVSARNADRLKEYVLRLREYARQPEQGVTLADVAYTLQTGRKVMEARLAVQASSFGELIGQLDAYLLGSRIGHPDGSGSIASGSGMAGAIKNTALQESLRKKDLNGLAKLWESGVSIPWNEQPRRPDARRVWLPAYPFERRSCRLPESEPAQPVVQKLQPLLPEYPVPSSGKQPPSRYQDWTTPLTSTPEAEQPYSGNEVKLEIVEECIALVTLCDMPNRNMYSDGMQAGLLSVFKTIDGLKGLKVVIVTGTDRLFCMGGTRDQLEGIANGQAQCVDTSFAYRGLLECRLPVIAAMQGHAVGGGLAFGLFADIVIMSEESVYSSNYTQYGFTPGVGATYIFAEKLGPALAQEMMYTAKAFRGIELKERGAAVAFAKSANVLTEAFATARMLAKKPLLTLTVLKQELAGRVLEQLPSILDREVAMHNILFREIDVNPLINMFFGTETEGQAGSGTAVSKRILPELAATDPDAGTIPLAGPPLTLRPPAAVPPAIEAAENGLQNKIALIQPFARPELGRAGRVSRPGIAAAPGTASSAAAVKGGLSYTDVKRHLEDILSLMLHVEPHELQGGMNFRDMGMDSISGVELMNQMNRILNLNLSAVLIYDYSNVEELARHISTEYVLPEPLAHAEKDGYGKAVTLAPLEAATPAARNGGQVVPQTKTEVRHQVAAIISRLLHVQPEDLSPATVFRDLGVDSISGVELVREIAVALSLNLNATIIYDYPTMDELCYFLTQEQLKKTGIAEADMKPDYSQEQGLLNLLERLQSEQLDIEQVDQWLEGWE